MLKNLFRLKGETPIQEEAAWIPFFAPIHGTVMPLEEVDDPVFAERMVGDGIAILPEGDTVVSPVAGILTHLFPSGHAAGITLSNGLEILIHVGLDTVELKGEGFTPLAEQGQVVKTGTPLIRLDLEKLKKTARSLTTPVIVTNMPRVKEIEKISTGTVKAGEDVIFRILPEPLV
jgi:sugar PTS system EIIA component